jgi:hypothetical protein
MIGAATHRRAWRPGGRRPGHPRHRTVRHHRRPAEAGTPAGTVAATGGDTTKLTDAELVTLAVMQALLGFTSEARWLRYAGRHLRHLFPYLPGQSGYNKRLRRAGELLRATIRAIACDTTLWSDDVWVVDSTPVECGRSRQTAKRSDLAGWAQDGYCASHSRWFWGLRLHLVCTLHGLPVAVALTGAKADERVVLLDLLTVESALVAARPGQVLLADKNYYGGEFERVLAGWACGCCGRPARASPSGPARGCSGRCGS